jgi:hypothetical protein
MNTQMTARQVAALPLEQALPIARATGISDVNVGQSFNPWRATGRAPQAELAQAWLDGRQEAGQNS